VQPTEFGERTRALAGVSGTKYFPIEAARCAVIVIDMQNGLVADGASSQVVYARDIIANIDPLVMFARDHGIPVLWTQSDHSPPGGGLVAECYPAVRYERQMCKGHESFEMFEDMVQPDPEEIVVVKPKYDAFHATNLDHILRNLGRDTLVIAGVATEVCCESTARSAFFHDYRVVFLRDATAALDSDAHEQACDRIDRYFGRAITTSDLIGILTRGGETPEDVKPDSTGASARAAVSRSSVE
jgi:ureidoacrylate peracid hydrolase